MDAILATVNAIGCSSSFDQAKKDVQILQKQLANLDQDPSLSISILNHIIKSDCMSPTSPNVIALRVLLPVVQKLVESSSSLPLHILCVQPSPIFSQIFWDAVLNITTTMSAWPQDCVAKLVRSLAGSGVGKEGLLQRLLLSVCACLPRASEHDIPPALERGLQCWSKAMSCVDALLCIVAREECSYSLESSILHLVEIAVFMLSPGLTEHTASHFMTYLKASDADLQLSNVITLTSLADYAGWTWLNRYGLNVRALISKASALFSGLTALLTQSPCIRHVLRTGSADNALALHSTVTDIAMRVADVGYCRPWFAEGGVTALLSFASEPPSPFAVSTAQRTFILHPALHATFRNAFGRLAASPACAAYGATINSLLLSWALPPVPVCHTPLLPPLPSFLVSPTGTIDGDDAALALDAIYRELQGRPVYSANAFTAAFAVDSLSTPEDLAEIAIMNLRHLPHLTHTEAEGYDRMGAWPSIRGLASVLSDLHGELLHTRKQQGSGKTTVRVGDAGAGVGVSVDLSTPLLRLERGIQSTWQKDGLKLPSFALQLVDALTNAVAALDLQEAASAVSCPQLRMLDHVEACVTAASKMSAGKERDDFRERISLQRVTSLCTRCILTADDDAAVTVFKTAVRCVLHCGFLLNATSRTPAEQLEAANTTRCWLLSYADRTTQLVNAILEGLDKASAFAGRVRTLATANHGVDASLALYPDGLVASVLLDIALLQGSTAPAYDAMIATCLSAQLSQEELKSFDVWTAASAAVNEHAKFSSFTHKAFIRIVPFLCTTSDAFAERLHKIFTDVCTKLLCLLNGDADGASVPVEWNSDVNVCQSYMQMCQNAAASMGADDEIQESRLLALLIGVARVALYMPATHIPSTIIGLMQLRFACSHLEGAHRFLGVACTTLSRRYCSLSGLMAASSIVADSDEGRDDSPFACSVLQSMLDDEVTRAVRGLRTMADLGSEQLRQHANMSNVDARLLVEYCTSLSAYVKAATQSAPLCNVETIIRLLPAAAFLENTVLEHVVIAVMRVGTHELLHQLVTRLAATPSVAPLCSAAEAVHFLLGHSNLLHDRSDIEIADKTKMLKATTDCMLVPQLRPYFAPQAVLNGIQRTAEGLVTPILLMRAILLFGKEYSEITGSLIGTLSALVRKRGAATFEAEADIVRWATDAAAAAVVPRWDGFVRIVHTFVPMSWTLLMPYIPAPHFDALLKCSREAALMERFKAWTTTTTASAKLPEELLKKLQSWQRPEQTKQDSSTAVKRPRDPRLESAS